MNRFWFSVILFCAISAYSGLSSIPIQFLLCCCATSAVVPAPRNGSRTVPFGGHPARMQGSTSSVGYVAKCAPLYGLVLISHTERLLRLPSCRVRLLVTPLPWTTRWVPLRVSCPMMTLPAVAPAAFRCCHVAPGVVFACSSIAWWL